MGIFSLLLKKPFFARFQRPWVWPESVSSERWQRVSFPSRGGAKLVGVFGPSDINPAQGAVVLAHPLTVAAKGFWLKNGHAELFRRAGFAVLAFDFNGFGESESTDFDYPADIISAGRYLHTIDANLPLAVIGASFGAGWAMCALANELHSFRAAVLEAVFPSLPFYWRRYSLPYSILRLSQLIYPPLERNLRPSDAAKGLQHKPDILLIYGEADTLTPPEIGLVLKSAMSGRAGVEMLTIPKADHNFAFQTAPAFYSHHIISFLRRSFAD
jgi:pimeloyl-ACP methyl ester carboxylesterase